jgi:hypothetical protein
MSQANVPFNPFPPTGPLASGGAPQSLLMPSPLNCHIAFTPTGAADGGFNVNWAVVCNYENPLTQASLTLASGSLRMLPTDSAAKLLYQIQAGAREGLKRLTIGQLLPSQPDTTYVTAPSGNTPASGSYFHLLELDCVAVLPENPANVGL